MAALGLAHPRCGHRCRRGRRHPRPAAVRMIGKRGASAHSRHSFFNALNREPGEDPASPRSCFRCAHWVWPERAHTGAIRHHPRPFNS
jgi:hypothetical protein